MDNQNSIILISIAALFGLIFIANTIRYFRPKRKSSVYGVLIPLLIAVAAVAAYFIFIYSPPSPYSVRFDTVRTTDRDSEPIDLSIWMYDDKGEVFKKFFADEKLIPEIQGTAWLILNDTEYKTIPSRRITEERKFDFQIKLNPNRLAQPPDGVFSAFIDFTELNGQPEQPVYITIRSTNQGLYVLRLELTVD